MSGIDVASNGYSENQPINPLTPELSDGSLIGVKISSIVDRTNALVQRVNNIICSEELKVVSEKILGYELGDLKNTLSQLNMKSLSSKTLKDLEQVEQKIIEVFEASKAEGVSQLTLEEFDEVMQTFSKFHSSKTKAESPKLSAIEVSGIGFEDFDGSDFSKYEEVVGDSLQRLAGWIEPDGTVSDEHKVKLLDEHEKTSNIRMCLDALAILRKADCLRNENLEVQIKIDHIACLLNFYKSELSESDPNFVKVVAAVEVLNSERVEDYVHLIFEKAKVDLENNFKMSKLTQHQYDVSKSTFNQMETIYKNLAIIANEKDDLSRNQKINQLTSGGAEQGFSSNGTNNEAYKILERRVHTLLLAYQLSKSKDELQTFLRKLGTGDPCLTARMGRVEDYLTEAVGFTYEQAVDREKMLELPITALENCLEFIVEHNNISLAKEDEFVRSLTKSDFEKEEIKQVLIEWLTTYQNTELSKEFYIYLEKDDRYEYAEGLPNWSEITSVFLDTPEFTESLAKAKDRYLLL